jgi:hypothetical protein
LGRPALVPGGPGLPTDVSRSVIVWIPLKPHLGVSCIWRLLAEWPRRTPLSRAEKPLIAFICELKKEVRIGLVRRDEGQPAISDRAGVAHGISNPQLFLDPRRPRSARALRSRAFYRARQEFQSHVTRKMPALNNAKLERTIASIAPGLSARALYKPSPPRHTTGPLSSSDGP